MDIILASTSPYRRRLLERLHLDFRCLPPDVDEAPLVGEAPGTTATRLALLKAKSVANRFPDALVIGSDQVATIEGSILNKPGNHAVATLQLQAVSGHEVKFHTGVALVCQGRSLERFHVEPYSVHFRSLDDTQIANYLRLEEPYDCAASFKVERLGIALVTHMVGADPTSLEGLPLIKLTELLAAVGIDVLGALVDDNVPHGLSDKLT